MAASLQVGLVGVVALLLTVVLVGNAYDPSLGVIVSIFYINAVNKFRTMNKLSTCNNVSLILPHMGHL